MPNQRNLSTRRRALIVASLLVGQAALLACSTEKYMFHSFSFDAIDESPDLEVLDYQYGIKSGYEREGGVGLRPTPYRLERGDIFTGVGITGSFPKGDCLYVKWRIKANGQILEDRVDLTNRLPKDITQHGIHFVIVNTQLFVYLIPPPLVWDPYAYKRIASNARYAAYFNKHQIYPDISL